MNLEHTMEHSLPSHSTFYYEEEFQSQRDNARSPPPPPPPPLSDTEDAEFDDEPTNRRFPSYSMNMEDDEPVQTIRTNVRQNTNMSATLNSVEDRPVGVSSNNTRSRAPQDFDDRPVGGSSTSSSINVRHSSAFALNNGANINNNASKKPVTPKPFLKKGSRREPSSLLKSPTSPTLNRHDEPSKEESSYPSSAKPKPMSDSRPNEPSASQTSRPPSNRDVKSVPAVRNSGYGASQSTQAARPATGTSSSSVVGQVRGSSSSITANKFVGDADKSLDESTGDILLQGSDYWNLEGTASSLLRAGGGIATQGPKTTRKDLDEFEMLERQIEMGIDDDANFTQSLMRNTTIVREPSGSNISNKLITHRPVNGHDLQAENSDNDDVYDESDTRHSSSQISNTRGYSIDDDQEQYEHLSDVRQIRRDYPAPGKLGDTMDSTNDFETLEQLRRQAPKDETQSFGRGYSNSLPNANSSLNNLGVSRAPQSPSWGSTARVSNHSQSKMEEKSSRGSSINREIGGVRNSYSSTEGSDMYSVASDRNVIEYQRPVATSLQSSVSHNGTDGIIRTRPVLGNQLPSSLPAANSSQSSGPNAPGHSRNAPSLQGRARTPTPGAARQQSPAPRVVQGGGGNGVVGKQAASSDFGNDYLTSKAKELEMEIESYKVENAQLKQTRKQQEATLAEIVHERTELLKWISEEKAKTTAWCEEQKQAALRERRAAARQARDSRNNSGTSVRKDRAEVEALQATIEKMKIDSEGQIKKLRTNERRLQQLVKDQTQRIEDLDADLLQTEGDKALLIAFIEKVPTRLPANIAKIVAAKGGSVPAAGAKRDSGVIRRIRADDGSGTYVEEVDVESVAGSDILQQYAKVTGNSMRGHGQTSYDPSPETDDRYDEAVGQGKLASAIFSRPGTGSNVGRQNLMNNSAAGGEFGNIRQHDTSQNPVLRGPEQSPEVILDRASANQSLPLRGVSSVNATMSTGMHAAPGHTIRVPDDVAASWARSSRSSRGSRYSGDADDCGDTEENSGIQHSDLVDGHSKETCAANRQPVDGIPKSVPRISIVEVPVGKANATAPLSTMVAPAGGIESVRSAPGENVAGSGSNSRTEETLPDGRKRISYRNGTVKEVLPDGKSLVKFVNGDTKRTDPSTGTIVYFYAQAKTTHTTYKDGLEVYEFPNNQMERHYSDGTKEILFPDSTRKVIHANGIQESFFSDGVVVREHPDGRKEVLGASSQISQVR